MSDFRVNQSSVNKVKHKQKGQISVFLALAFLVLFTMFAMTINVGMVVHDKINLQNAVDFSSIYVAQRQAEMLNAIAHFNYQIRQAHKLLAYRYVVLGTAGIDTARTINNLTEVVDPLAVKFNYPACYSDRKIMDYPGGNGDSWCDTDRFSRGLPALTVLPVVNPRLGSNSGLQTATMNLIAAIQEQAARISTINWWFTANSMASYKLQIAYRKAMIKALATNLTRPIEAGAQGMKDLRGQSVFEGARKTFEFNLSESARRSGGFNIQIRNSMAGVDIRNWLPEVAIHVLPYYSDLPAYTGRHTPRVYSELPQSYQQFQAAIDPTFNQLDPESVIRDMRFPYNEGHPFEEILGFEKNPWYMVYNQVQGSSRTGALFSPNNGQTLQAQAFAKPFGGIIGPWFGRDWPQGSSRSSEDKVEPLWPNRKIGNAQPTGIDQTLFPNVPKYPGDQLGLQSHLAQASTGWLGGSGSLPPRKFHVNDYIRTAYDLLPGGTGQALAWNPNINPIDNFMYRKELAAIAPDLFDITYYSIEPNFDENYLTDKLDTWLVSEANQFLSSAGLTYNGQVWRDIGFSSQRDQQNFAVKTQLSLGRERIENIRAQDVFYFLNAGPEGLANVLTSWVGGTDVTDYRGPSSSSVRARFGRCDRFYSSSTARPNIPGECLNNGGRTGYSVKIVSKNYLLSTQHRMSPGSTGAIANPPQN